MAIDIGDIARDKITGFQGVVVGVHRWLHGCTTLTIRSQELKDGKPLDGVSFDEPQCELVKSGAFHGQQITGGPKPEPQRPNR